MAGLTREGFTSKSYEEIKANIEAKLNIRNPGFDFSPESPDGQFSDIMAFEISQAWQELSTISESHDPAQAVGAGLRNLGFISGVPYGASTRSSATIALTGTSGTIIPQGSLVADTNGNEFVTEQKAIIPSSVNVQASVSGRIPVPAGAVSSIKSAIVGWVGINQANPGREGTLAMTDQQFRTYRSRTVMRNFVGIAQTISARLLELGVAQVNVLSNDKNTALPDGTPVGYVHVTLSDTVGISDVDIGLAILDTKGLGTPTYGASSVVVEDQQGNSHTINFTRSTAVPVYLALDITFLDPDSAGAVESITDELVAHINSLLTNEDVIWSRLFPFITKYGKAQINGLLLDRVDPPLASTNLVITPTEFANINIADINITVSV